MMDCYASWKNWRSADFGRFESEDALYYVQELHVSGIDSVCDLRVAELGYGNGTFAGWVKNEGGHWIGREAIPALQHRATAAGFDVIDTEAHFSTAFGPEALDLIVAFDVIEHLEISATLTFLREAEEALRPGGVLLARIPSGDSPFSGAIFYGDLTHRTLLGSSAVSQLAMGAGFDVCQVRSPALPVSGLGLVRAARRLAIQLVQSIAFWFIRNVLMGNADAVISPNMIVILRKKGVPG